MMQLEEHRKTLIHSAACVLDQHGLIHYERQTPFYSAQLGEYRLIIMLILIPLLRLMSI